METKINKISNVEYELVIDATADDLVADFKAALRQQRGQTELKGFRPGKVPLSLVKKMHGRAVAFGLAEQKVQKTFEDEVLKGDEYDVIGAPKLTELDYDMDRDLHAIVRFGIRPDVEVKDVSGETLSRLKRDITEEDVDEQVDRIRRDNAELVPVEDEPIDDSFQVVVDLQQIDEASNTPIIGEKEENVELSLDDKRLHEELRDELLGRKSGDVFRIDLPHGDSAHSHVHRYEVTIKEAKRRELPELDDAFVGEISKDQFVSVDDLRESLRKNLEDAWKQRSREMLDGQIVAKMLELHDVPVPDSAVDMYLDSFVQDVKERNDGKLPAGFDEEGFRNANRDEAEKQARWMLIRDAFIKQEDLEVADEDLDAYFEEAAAGSKDITSEMLRRYYQSANMMDSAKQQVLSRKVFGRLAEMFNIEEKDLEEFEEEAKARVESEQNEPSSAIITSP